jgi:hypothetical protein
VRRRNDVDHVSVRLGPGGAVVVAELAQALDRFGGGRGDDGYDVGDAHGVGTFPHRRQARNAYFVTAIV